MREEGLLGGAAHGQIQVLMQQMLDDAYCYVFKHLGVLLPQIGGSN